MNDFEKVSYKTSFDTERGQLCHRLGRGSYLFLPAVFGWLSTLFILVIQTLLISRDITTIEYLKGLTEMKVRLEQPKEIQQDKVRREKKKKNVRRKNVIQMNEIGMNSNGMVVDDGDDVDDVDVDVDDHGHTVDLMESGSPVGGMMIDGGVGSTTGSIIGSTTSFAYNPHKSFRLLIIQQQPLWTLFVPPILIPTRFGGRNNGERSNKNNQNIRRTI